MLFDFHFNSTFLDEVEINIISVLSGLILVGQYSLSITLLERCMHLCLLRHIFYKHYMCLSSSLHRFIYQEYHQLKIGKLKPPPTNK